VREVLERGATRVRRELKDEPLLQARMLRTVGDVYTTLGLFAEATPMLDDALRLARDQGQSGQTEMVRGLVALGRLKRQIDDLSGAEAALRAAVSIQEQAGGEIAADLGSTLNQLALVLRHKDPEQALRLYQRSLAATEATRGRDSGEAGVVLANIGSLQLRTGRYEEARRSFDQSLPLVSKHHGESDPRVSGILGNLAIVERELGNLERAVELHQRDLEHSSRALGGEHPAVGTIWLNLARTTMRLGEHERALSQIDKAAAILRASLAPNHALVLSAEVSRLRCLFRLGRLQEARQLAAALIALDGTSAEGKTVQLATTLLLAEMESLDGRSGEALRLIATVLDDPLSAKSGTTVPDGLWARACVLARRQDTAADDARRAASAAMKGDGRSAREAALVAEARYAACAGDARRSAQWLQEAVKLGFRDRGVLFDPSFATVRKDAAFAAVRIPNS
jgi:tetratricopeptide (TPR) repeat protein